MKAVVFDPDTRKQIAAMRLAVRRLFSGEGGGAIRARGIGAGHDFHDHKAYSHGDDFRHIDWNLFGRHDALFVKRFRQETDLDFQIILDATASMAVGKPRKDVFSRRLACALAACFANSAQPFELRLAAKGMPTCAPRICSDADLNGAMDSLEKWASSPSRATLDLHHGLNSHARNRVVIYMGDLLDGGEILAQLARMRNDKTEVICALICTAEERAPTLSGNLQLRDIEGRESLHVHVTPALLDAYVQRFDAHLQDCQRQALGHGLSFIILDSGTPLQRAVVDLARRGTLVP